MNTQHSNSQVISIREARKEDARKLLEYLKIIGSESDNLLIDQNGLPYSIEEEEKIIEDRRKSLRSKFFIGFVGEEIVSSLSLAASSRKRVEHNAELGISVLKIYWNKGVGTQMMDFAIKFSVNSGLIRNIYLEVRKDNHSAIHLYEKMGFKQLATLENKIRINDVYLDEVLMVKHLY